MVIGQYGRIRRRVHALRRDTFAAFSGELDNVRNWTLSRSKSGLRKNLSQRLKKAYISSGIEAGLRQCYECRFRTQSILG